MLRLIFRRGHTYSFPRNITLSSKNVRPTLREIINDGKYIEVVCCSCSQDTRALLASQRELKYSLEEAEERETILKDASETVRAQLEKEEGHGQELTAAVHHLELQLTTAEESVQQLTADSAGLRQELQAAETRTEEKIADGKTMAEELENTAVLAGQLEAAEVKLRSQLVEAEGQVQQLKLASKELESRLRETTAAWDAAEEREAEALNEVIAGSLHPEPLSVYAKLAVCSPQSFDIPQYILCTLPPFNYTSLGVSH